MIDKHVFIKCEIASKIGLPEVHEPRPDCVVIAIVEDGYVTSASHDSSEIDPVTRMNSDCSIFEDYRNVEDLYLTNDGKGISLLRY